MSTAVRPPLIGLTTYRQRAAWGAWDREAALCPAGYLDAVQRAGAQPVLLPVPAAWATAGLAAAADALVGRLDALVLVGGGDVDPSRYGQSADPRSGGVDPRRDDLESALAAEAIRQDVPVLAVCRGMQVLNVVLGGALVQHLPDGLGSSGHQPAPGAFGPVEVVTEEGTEVRRVLGPRLEVLCSHHQAIDTLGRGLVVTARSTDGVVEAVELPGARFVVGVQWHPEEQGDARLFEALVAATAGA